MTGTAWVAFLVAAGLGAPARYLVDGWVQDRTDGDFPWGTLIVNVSGCLILGFLTGLGLYHGLGATPRTVLGTGAMGAYTTFSTFSWETVALAESGEVVEAARYLVASLLVGLLAAAAGLAVATL